MGSLNLFAQVGMSKSRDAALIDKAKVQFSHVTEGKNVLEGTYIFKNGSFLNYQRSFSDHPGLYAQEYIPGDFYNINNYRQQLSQFLKLILDKNDYDAVEGKIKINKFDNYMEFNIDVPGYSEFIVNIRIDPHGINLFLSYYSAA